jgi:hypothetical protein
MMRLQAVLNSSPARLEDCENTTIFEDYMLNKQDVSGGPFRGLIRARPNSGVALGAPLDRSP